MSSVTNGYRDYADISWDDMREGRMQEIYFSGFSVVLVGVAEALGSAELDSAWGGGGGCADLARLLIPRMRSPYR